MFAATWDQWSTLLKQLTVCVHFPRTFVQLGLVFNSGIFCLFYVHQSIIYICFFSRGSCYSTCGLSAAKCTALGYHADKYPARGKFYIDTQSAAPYCSTDSIYSAFLMHLFSFKIFICYYTHRWSCSIGNRCISFTSGH